MSPFRHILIAGVMALPAMLAWSGHGHAEFIKRGMLVSSCTGRDPARINDCSGYILGIADAAIIMPGSGGKPDVCIQGKVTGKAMREGVVAYLSGHPAAADSAAAPAVLDALRALYKC
jgi:hypothetical protein